MTGDFLRPSIVAHVSLCCKKMKKEGIGFQQELEVLYVFLVTNLYYIYEMIQ